jgi:hypothetical protein
MVSADPYAIDLKAEVEAVVKPYADSKDRPPFSLADLAVMAWVCRKNDSGIITEKETLEWVMRTFRYYFNLAVDEIHRATETTG